MIVCWKKDYQRLTVNIALVATICPPHVRAPAHIHQCISMHPAMLDLPRASIPENRRIMPEDHLDTATASIQPRHPSHSSSLVTINVLLSPCHPLNTHSRRSSEARAGRARFQPLLPRLNIATPVMFPTSRQCKPAMLLHTQRRHSQQSTGAPIQPQPPLLTPMPHFTTPTISSKIRTVKHLAYPETPPLRHIPTYSSPLLTTYSPSRQRQPRLRLNHLSLSSRNSITKRHYPSSSNSSSHNTGNSSLRARGHNHTSPRMLLILVTRRKRFHRPHSIHPSSPRLRKA